MSEQKKREGNEIFTPAGAQSQGMATRNVMKDDFSFEIPVESVPLPTKGLVYPVDSPIHGCETVDIKAMTAKEEDILTSRALIKKGTVITALLQSCLIDKAIQTDKMLSGDRNAIMTALRVTGYGADYKVEVECPACDERSKQDFNLAELPIKRLGIDPIAPGANLFEFELPVTKKKVHFRFLTGEDEREMSTIAERRKKSGMNDAMVTQRLHQTIVSIDGVTDKNKINMFVRNMPARDSLSLRKYMEEHEPGIEMKAWMECPHCFESSEVRLPMGASFFWPDSE